MQINVVVRIVQWLIRIYGGVLMAAILLFAILEGVPDPFTQPFPVRMEFFGMLIILVGLAVGWWKQGFGGLLVVVGMLIFHVVEKKLFLGGLFPFYDLAAILYLISWWLKDILNSDENEAIKKGGR